MQTVGCTQWGCQGSSWDDYQDSAFKAQLGAASALCLPPTPLGQNQLPPPGVQLEHASLRFFHPRRLSSSRTDWVVSPAARPRAALSQGLGT